VRGPALKSVSEREKADADSIKNLNALEKALSALLNEENARTYAEDTARQALQDLAEAERRAKAAEVGLSNSGREMRDV
jgi:hypothetical protein